MSYVFILVLNFDLKYSILIVNALTDTYYF